MPKDDIPYKGPFQDVPDEKMIVINDLSEIPPFANEDDEADFWDTHTFAEHLWRKERGPRPGSLAEKLSKERFKPRAVLNKDADAAYVYLTWGRTAKTVLLDDSRTVHYDADGKPIQVEFLRVSRGIHLRGVPECQHVEDLLKDLNLNVFA